MTEDDDTPFPPADDADLQDQPARPRRTGHRLHAAGRITRACRHLCGPCDPGRRGRGRDAAAPGSAGQHGRGDGGQRAIRPRDRRDPVRRRAGGPVHHCGVRTADRAQRRARRRAALAAVRPARRCRWGAQCAVTSAPPAGPRRGSDQRVRPPRDAFDDDAAELGELFAAPAAVAVHNAQVLWQARTLVEQLERAITNRPIIDQAIGIVRSRTGASAEDTMTRLRALSQSEHVKLTDIARRIVDQAADRARCAASRADACRGRFRLDCQYSRRGDVAGPHLMRCTRRPSRIASAVLVRARPDRVQERTESLS